MADTMEAAPISKRALEKERKKAEKKALKESNTTALKPNTGASIPKNKNPTNAPEPENIFTSRWLRGVYDEKPVPAVRTRFPPEPNGFLHIGHAKAIRVNFGFAEAHDGVCFLRYDDTNPSKEEEIYFTAIKDMVEWLGFKPFKITYSSDHFDRLYNLAEKLIEKDRAYVCMCNREEINRQRGGPDNRGPRYGCEHRTRPVKESLEEFRAMRDGKYKAGEAFLRMKQKITDPNEGNPQMWDLPAYRVVEKNHHHRTGDRWRIYPTYDFTHCICDAFEEISHSMCTVEFRNSRESYDWLLEELGMKIPNSEEKGPMQREYSRLDVVGTILSKRKIQTLVEGTTVEKKLADGTTETKRIPPAVRGWDDPRLFTLVALRRRGIPAKALIDFVDTIGVSDALTKISVEKLDFQVRKLLERTVKRMMLVLDPIKVIITNLAHTEEGEISVDYDPKGIIPGSRMVKFSKEIYIERSDFKVEDDPDFQRLALGKYVGLQNAITITAIRFEKDASGCVTEVLALAVKDLPEGTPKPRFIHWVDANTNVQVIAHEYNALFNKDSEDALDWKEGGWATALNPESEIVYHNAVIERGFSALVDENKLDPGSASDNIVRFQGIRTGFFCVDPEKEDGKIVLNQIVSLKEAKPIEPEAKPKAKANKKNASKTAKPPHPNGNLVDPVTVDEVHVKSRTVKEKIKVNLDNFEENRTKSTLAETLPIREKSDKADIAK